MNDPLANARAALQEPASRWAWRALCHALDHAPRLAPPELDALVGYCSQHLRRWPDALRVAPDHWIARALDGAPQPQLAVCRVFTIPHVGASSRAISELTLGPHLADAADISVRDDLPLPALVDALTAPLDHPTARVELDVARLDAVELLELMDHLPAHRRRGGSVGLSGHVTGDMSRVFGHPAASSITRLDLGDELVHRYFPDLCASTRLHELSSLDLSSVPLDASSAARLGRSHIRPRELTLRLAPGGQGDLLFDGIDDDHGALAAEALVDLGVLERVNDLRLIRAATLPATILGGDLPRLTTLRSIHPDEPLGGALTRGRALEHVELQGRGHAGALAALDPSALRALTLSRVDLGADDLAALSRARALERVHTDDAEVMAALAAAPMPHMQELTLEWASVTEPSAVTLEAITRAEWFTSLRALTIVANEGLGASETICRALSRADLSGLRSLTLSNASLDADRARLALTSPTPHLQHLSLHGARLSDGLAGLSPHNLRSLLELDLRVEKMSAARLASRFEHGDLGGLDTLRVGALSEGGDLARVLRSAGRLRALHASRCALDGAFFDAFASSGISSLDIRRCRVDADGLRRALGSREAARLDTLRVSSTLTTDHAAVDHLLPPPGGHLSPRLLARARVAAPRSPSD